jgi:hypothetical protein
VGADTIKLSLTPTDYYRQYVGIIVHGRRLIYINGFHSMFLGMQARVDSATRNAKQARQWNWRRVPVFVCDGGYGFFGAVYDPALDRVEDFGFNGVG